MTNAIRFGVQTNSKITTLLTTHKYKKMIDNTKLIITLKSLIDRLYINTDDLIVKGFTLQQTETKETYLSPYGAKTSISFFKTRYKGEVWAYSYLEILTSPHYHFNNYLHNGNDFTPMQCLETLKDVLAMYGIEESDYLDVKVVNIEFAYNVVPTIDTKDLVAGILHTMRTKFIVPIAIYPHSKKSQTTKYKEIKAYHKGVQFPQYVNPNTFRFEVKSKQSRKINKFGIYSVADLFKIEIYKTLHIEIMKEWQNVLVIPKEYTSSYKRANLPFLNSCLKPNYWHRLLRAETNRNQHGKDKKKYYKLLSYSDHWHTQIRDLLERKFIEWLKNANSTLQTPINTPNHSSKLHTPLLINVESAPLNQKKPTENREKTSSKSNKCLVTKLDISMQKEGSKYLCIGGLSYYKKREPEVWKTLERMYLTDKQKTAEEEKQIYYIAHNIRNSFTNKIHNRKKFEQRNYPAHQLQLNFAY